MDRALLLALEPLNNARFVELAEAFQPCQRLSHLVFFHADCALLRAAVFVDAVLLRGRE